MRGPITPSHFRFIARFLSKTQPPTTLSACHQLPSEKHRFAWSTRSFLHAPSHPSHHPNLQPRRQSKPIPHRRPHRHKIQMNAHSMHPPERPIPPLHLRTDFSTVTPPPLPRLYNAPILVSIQFLNLPYRGERYPDEPSAPSPLASSVRRRAGSAMLSLRLLLVAADHEGIPLGIWHRVEGGWRLLRARGRFAGGSRWGRHVSGGW